MRLAYADPPYLGCCSKYGHRHTEPWGCWDDLETHKRLLNYLGTFDGWAYSMTSGSLHQILPLVDSSVRIASWNKTFAAFKPNVRCAYTWEPVLFIPGRDRSKEGAPLGRDHIGEPITLKKGLTGAKPERFCQWILMLLGFMSGDDVIDVFPGTGIMSKIVSAGVVDPGGPKKSRK